jgi:raffinose/stachyose/melibiose transport system substrate-binding protein
MTMPSNRRGAGTVAALAACAVLALSACSSSSKPGAAAPPSSGSSSPASAGTSSAASAAPTAASGSAAVASSAPAPTGPNVTITLLTDNTPADATTAGDLAAAFNATNQGVTVKVDASRPGGTDGDNAIKTKLATGDMADVFLYNDGSLFQAIDPAKNLVPLTGHPYMSNVDPSFLPTVTEGKDVYGVPVGAAVGGGFLYNIAVYNKLSLSVPTTWAQFLANSAKIKAAGIAPVIQTYGDTWTSQLLVLADFHNVAAQHPNFATEWTQNKANFESLPALEGFQRLEQLHKLGYFNSDYASAKLEQGLNELATGKGAQYPILTFALSTLLTDNPTAANNIGFFAQPGNDASYNGLTTWYPNALYIPKTTKGDKLAATEKFLAWVTTPASCDVQTKAITPTGPYVVKGCALPPGLPRAVTDLQGYFGSGKASPALEFLSAVKGPNLENFTVEVGSGISSALKGAAAYDQDSKKEAKQLNLPGW